MHLSGRYQNPVRSTGKPLDTQKSHGYKVRHFLTAAVLLTAFSAGAQAGMVVRGAVLPAGSVQIAEDRYKSPRNYVDTLSFYSKVYRDKPRKTIVNQPGIRAVHIVNDGSGDWEGLNVYELDGETRIFIVPRTRTQRGK
jgi:hypothetical protein